MFGLPGLRDDGRRGARRAQVRAPQRLADIDIAEPGNILLIEQRALQRLRLAGEAFRQIGGTELVAGRFRSQAEEEGIEVKFGTLCTYP